MTDWKTTARAARVIHANRYTTSRGRCISFPSLPRTGVGAISELAVRLRIRPAGDSEAGSGAVPARAARALLSDGRAAKRGNGRGKDIHESDLRHLEASAHAAQYVAGRDGWVTVECAAGERYRTREDIAAEIRGHIEALLHV